MKSIILDTNIYDKLNIDFCTRKIIKKLVKEGKLSMLMPRTVAEELFLSSLKEVSSYFPIKFVGNTVGNVNMGVSDSIGLGEVFEMHVGESKKINDAYIVDAADWFADWLVSEDTRLRNRAAKISNRFRSMKYCEFVQELVILDQLHNNLKA
jgi:hypothetical protein